MLIAKVTPLPVARVFAAIDAWVKRQAWPANDVVFYLPDDPGVAGFDKYGPGSCGTIVLQGPGLNGVLNFRDADEVYQDFVDLLESHGYMHELGYEWTCHLYPLDA